MTRKKPTDSKYTSLQPPTTGNRGVEEDRRYTSMPPVLNPLFEEARELKTAFIQDFWRDPWAEYINGTGISKVKRHDSTAVDNLEDFCLSVTLRKAFPDDLHLPSEYSANNKTIRVYSKVVGENNALSDLATKSNTFRDLAIKSKE